SVKGEIVIVIDPPSEAERTADADRTAADATTRAAELTAAGERPKSVARTIAAEFNLPRNQAYEIALAAKGAQ
ncbi:MAG: 16S rRNA (cytidine(1402)-2'-O)-methyltransferase, partial [Eggerthellaceae bacterium]|nr:16S rRNA (cytidine(1402)-2'-O)-methyltransferase [Eggerthellaceae bacterium]